MISKTSHTIRVEALPRLETLVAEHNRKIAKLNKRHGASLASMSYKVLRTWTAGPPDMAAVDADASRRPYLAGTIVADVEITGEKPVLAGWAIVGILTLTDEGYLVSRIRDAKYADVAPFAKRGGDCDHCKAARRRTTTYLLRTAEGQDSNPHLAATAIKVIGSTCLKDFTGHDSPALLASYADYSVGFDAELAELEDMDDSSKSGWGGGARRGAMPLAKYLAFVRQAVRTKGWLSKGRAYEQGYGVPTAVQAINAVDTISYMVESLALIPLVDRTPEQDVQFYASKSEIEKALPTEEDVEAAGSDLALVDDTFSAQETPGEFEQNILTVVRQGYAFGKNLGLAAAIYKAAERIRSDAQRAANKLTDKNEHFGTIGKREVFTLKCVFTTTTEGNFGPTQLCIFRDKEGRSAKWFNSGKEELEKGTTYEIKATVKKHDTWEGKLTTMLSRCAIQKQPEASDGKETPF